MTNLSVHPDVPRLREEIADLRNRLAEALERTLYMEEIEGPELRAKYHDELGTFELDILELRFENAVVERKIERLIQRQRRSQPITPDYLERIDRQIEHDLADWREEIHTKRRRVHESRETLYRISFQDTEGVEGIEGIEGSTRCSDLYRSLCVALHPDLGAEPSDAFEAWWHAIEKSYVQRDVDSLEIIAFVLEIDLDDETLNPLAARDISLEELDELRRERNRLRERLARERETHASMRNHPPFSYRDLLRDRRALERRRTELKQRATSLRRRRDRLRMLLERKLPFEASHTEEHPSSHRRLGRPGDVTERATRS